jgi:lipopolysaccharide/colanic/teichoic acid biosynthesis glycosyltransferase
VPVSLAPRRKVASTSSTLKPFIDLRLGASTHSAPRPARSRRKRALDLALAGILLLLTSPVWLALAIAIVATTRGPVLFRQRRIGLDGKPFTLLKFRSMQYGVSEAIHERFVSAMISAPPAVAGPQAAIHKLQNDPRITPIGRWMRRTSLDELPQLINVLRGEMSLVGPRPPLAYEVAKYESWQYERLAARPGITGLWQVSGRNRLTYFEMCQTDVRYVRNWSFSMDLRIILRTPWAMFVDRGGAS